MNKKQIFNLIFFPILGGIIYYVSNIIGVCEFIVSMIVYSLVCYFIHVTWFKIRHKTHYDFLDFCELFLYKTGILILVVAAILGIFGYYQNTINPAKMPEVTITNGKKVIIFQGMSHIGGKKFYDTIEENIRKNKKKGFVYFFEGVTPGTKENADRFNQALGIKFDHNLYKNFAKLYGVVEQDQSKFLGLINQQDFNIDLNLNEIMELYGPGNPNDNTEKEAVELGTQIINLVSKLNDRQLSILRYINKSILNFITKSEGIRNILSDTLIDAKLFDIILHKRNELLADTITKTKYDKIYITYGALHLQGTLELLQKQDPNWRISNTTYYLLMQ